VRRPGATSRRSLLVAAAALLALAGCGSNAGAGTASPPRTASAAGATQQSPSEGSELTYSVLPYGSAVTPEKIQATVAALQQRLAAARIGGSVSSSGEQIVIRIPGAGTGAPPVTSSPQLYFYDWEPNLIGPGTSPAARPEYQAVLRAARRAPELRASDTTWQQGCTPRQLGGCLYGGFYLLDTAHAKMVCPRGSSQCAAAPTPSSLLQATRPRSFAHLRVVRVAPGTVLVQSRPREAANGHVISRSPNSYYVLKDDPALSGAEITNPQPGSAELAGAPPQPSVTFSFTAEGRPAFERLTKGVAHRGQEAQLPGITKDAAEQHFAIVLDGQLIAAPSIDYTRYPEGIDASHGSEVSGGLTPASAKALAEEIQAGSLPVRIVLHTEDLETTFR